MNTDAAERPALRHTRSQIGLGAAFYPEYLPAGHNTRQDIRRHLDLMVDAGIHVIRVGESVWSTWEPQDAHFDLEWLAPVLDDAHERGIRVMLGTPTYAIPPWLQKKHSDLAVVRPDGNTVGFGARQEVDYLSPVFRTYAERVIRAILARYAHHPAIEAVQVDNEPGLHLIANPHVIDTFVANLRAKYGTVDALNDAWGLTYWSHRLAHWNELWHPRGNTVPGYDLDWRRFQAAKTTEFIAWQAGIAREYLRPDQYVTTCIAYNRAAVNDVSLGAALDVVSGNCYLDAQDALRADADSHHGPDYWFTTSPAGLFHQADRMRSSQNRGFLVTETGATSIAGSHHNFPPYDGQLRQIGWALVARGAELIEYWHWHTLHRGAEQMWGGVLGHNLQPGRIYQEISRLGNEIRDTGTITTGLTPDEDIGFFFSRDSRWAMQFQPPLALAGSTQPDRWSYDRIQTRFAEAAFDAHLTVGIIADEQLTDAAALLARHNTLVVAGASTLSDATAQTLLDYAHAGGRLILGIRSGAGDPHGGLRPETLPGPFREASGVNITESSNVRDAVPLKSGGHADAWIDAVEPHTATVIDGYDHPHFARWAAIAEHPWGHGSILTIGTLPDRTTLARILAARIDRRSATTFIDLPYGTSVHGAQNAHGQRIWFVHNWSPTPTTVTARHTLRDAITGEHATTLTLTSWDVRVLIEEETP